MKQSIKQNIYNKVKLIPRGETRSYKQIAKASKTHPRTVASALKQNFNPDIPCHRVILSSGKLGGYNRGIKLKKELLRKERAIQNQLLIN